MRSASERSEGLRCLKTDDSSNCRSTMVVVLLLLSPLSRRWWDRLDDGEGDGDRSADEVWKWVLPRIGTEARATEWRESALGAEKVVELLRRLAT